jgi:phage gpG-like protein
MSYDAYFSPREIALAINKQDFIPSGLATLFDFFGSTSLDVWLEEPALNAVDATAGAMVRGGPAPAVAIGKRKRHKFTVETFGEQAALLADEVLGMSAAGSFVNPEMLMTRRDEIIKYLVDWATAKQEYLRMWCVNNPDNDFGTRPAEVQIAFGTDGTKTRAKIFSAITKPLRDSLLGIPYRRAVAMCSDGAWEAILGNAEMRNSYIYSAQAAEVRGDTTEEFVYGGVLWRNYRGTSSTKIPDNKIVVVPEGVPGLFVQAYAPNDTVNTVGQGQRGQPYYLETFDLDDNKGWRTEDSDPPGHGLHPPAIRSPLRPVTHALPDPRRAGIRLRTKRRGRTAGAGRDRAGRHPPRCRTRGDGWANRHGATRAVRRAARGAAIRIIDHRALDCVVGAVADRDGQTGRRGGPLSGRHRGLARPRQGCHPARRVRSKASRPDRHSFWRISCGPGAGDDLRRGLGIAIHAMTGLAIRVTGSALKGLPEYTKRLKNLKPAMDAIGAAILSEVDLGFREQRDPWGVRGRRYPKDHAANAGRKGKGKGRGTQILMNTGKLAESFSHQATKRSVVVGTTKKYAGTHQFGAAQGAYGRTKRNGPIPWGDIPARPMLPIRGGKVDLPKDMQLEIMDAVLTHLEAR